MIIDSLENKKRVLEKFLALAGDEGWNLNTIKNACTACNIEDKFSTIIFEEGVSELTKFYVSSYNQEFLENFQKWLNTQKLPLGFIFFNFALSNYDGLLTIYAPENDNNISHTIMLNNDKNSLNVKCYNLKTIQSMLKHSNIDLLKMDIEGFEYDVIDDIIKNNIKPKQILLEFHHFYPTIGNIKTELYINKIKQYGYNLFYVSNNFCEFSFILV